MTTGPDGSPGTSVAVEYLAKEANSETKIGMTFLLIFLFIFSKDVSFQLEQNWLPLGVELLTSFETAKELLNILVQLILKIL